MNSEHEKTPESPTPPRAPPGLVDRLLTGKVVRIVVSIPCLIIMGATILSLPTLVQGGENIIPALPFILVLFIGIPAWLIWSVRKFSMITAGKSKKFWTFRSVLKLLAQPHGAVLVMLIFLQVMEHDPRYVAAAFGLLLVALFILNRRDKRKIDRRGRVLRYVFDMIFIGFIPVLFVSVMAYDPRYFAAGFGLLLVALLILNWRDKRKIDRRGWRVRCVAAGHWAYEERREEGWVGVALEELGDYRESPHIIGIPAAERWSRFPAWSSERRDEIIERVKSVLKTPHYVLKDA